MRKILVDEVVAGAQLIYTYVDNIIKRSSTNSIQMFSKGITGCVGVFLRSPQPKKRIPAVKPVYFQTVGAAVTLVGAENEEKWLYNAYTHSVLRANMRPADRRIGYIRSLRGRD